MSSNLTGSTTEDVPWLTMGVVMMNQGFPTEISLKIEQRHLDNGTKGSCQSCPVALALKEHLDDLEIEFDHVEVFRSVIGAYNYLGRSLSIARYKPVGKLEIRKALKFILTFDSSRCDDPEPTTIKYQLQSD